jgi:short-subunit dehydrogenase
MQVREKKEEIFYVLQSTRNSDFDQQVLHHDLIDRDIYLTHLAPGFVMSGFHDSIHGDAKRSLLSEFMTAEKCAEIAVDGIVKGQREVRFEWLPTLLMPIESISTSTGILDGFVRWKARRGVVKGSS